MISLSRNFETIPEGVYVFRIEKIDYNEDFGRMLVTLKTQTGRTHVERYGLLDKKGEPNSGAMAAFSFFARTAMNDMSLEQIDEQDLVGRYIKATVVHDIRESTKEPGKTVTFINLADKEPASGFEDEGYMSTSDAESEDDLLRNLLG